jgi:hypothetical protein
MSKVFIMIDDNIYKKVVPAYDYQENSLNNFINNNFNIKTQYIINPNINYYIDKFDFSSFNGDYSDFYLLIREDGSSSIISKNEEKLKSFCAYRNRLVSPM